MALSIGSYDLFNEMTSHFQEGDVMLYFRMIRKKSPLISYFDVAKSLTQNNVETFETFSLLYRNYNIFQQNFYSLYYFILQKVAFWLFLISLENF